MTVKTAARTLRAFLTDLSSDKPVPGGGAAAALTGALACALIAMTASINARRQVQRGLKPVSAATARSAARLGSAYLDLADRDAAAFARYAAARTPAERRAARRICLKPPLRMSRAADKAGRLIDAEVARTSRWLASDLKEAALLLTAAHESAALNVDINLDSTERLPRAEMKRRSAALRRLSLRVIRAGYAG